MKFVRILTTILTLAIGIIATAFIIYLNKSFVNSESSVGGAISMVIFLPVQIVLFITVLATIVGGSISIFPGILSTNLSYKTVSILLLICYIAILGINIGSAIKLGSIV